MCTIHGEAAVVSQLPEINQYDSVHQSKNSHSLTIVIKWNEKPYSVIYPVCLDD